MAIIIAEAIICRVAGDLPIRIPGQNLIRGGVHLIRYGPPGGSRGPGIDDLNPHTTLTGGFCAPAPGRLDKNEMILARTVSVVYS